MDKPSVISTERLRDRPSWHGYLVPWITPWRMTRDGMVPVFAGNDEILRQKAIRERLCSQCGHFIGPNGTPMAFIGDKDCCDARQFEEPGMHEDCARFAGASCPWLANPEYERPSDPLRPHAADPMVRMVPWAQRCPGRPDAGDIFLYLCHYYLPWPLPNGVLYARAGRADGIEKIMS